MEKGQEQMMEIIVSQVCEMFVLDFVGYKIEGFSSIREARIQKGCLEEADGNLGPRNK